jgi:hypothetical protein
LISQKTIFFRIACICVSETAMLFGIRQYSGAVTADIKKPTKEERKNERVEMSKSGETQSRKCTVRCIDRGRHMT